MYVNRWRTWRRPDDRGAVATVFTLLLAGGVLLGVMALVVDVGQIYVERSELQSGADAGVLAAAKACATVPDDCDLARVGEIAQDYADVNATDGVSKVASVCGRLQPGGVDSCGAQPDNLTACLGTPPPDDLYVEVRLSTQLADGRTILPPAFAQGVAPDFDGVSVAACARATWGPGALTILAITATICQFNDATNDGTEFVDPDDASTSDEAVIQFWTGSVGACDSDPEPDWQSPNQAGFLDGGGALCQIGVSNDGVVSGSFIGFEPFDLAPASCEDRVRQAWVSHELDLPADPRW